MDDLKKFLDFYGPLEKDEVTAVVLLARKKYAPELKKSERTIDYLLLRGPLTTEEMYKMIIAFIKHYTELPIFTKSGDHVPLRALSFSILTSPREKSKVAKHYVTKTMVQALDEDYDAVLEAKWRVLSALMSVSGKRHILFDVDVPGEKGLKIVDEITKNIPCEYAVVQTHGGYHVLMKRGPCLKALADYRPSEGVEWKNVVLAALPDTPRGGVMTKLVTLKALEKV